MNFDHNSTTTKATSNTNTSFPINIDNDTVDLPADNFDTILEELGKKNETPKEELNDELLEAKLEPEKAIEDNSVPAQHLTQDEVEEIKEPEDDDQDHVSAFSKVLLVIGPLFLLACLGISFYMLNKSPETLETFFIGK